MNIFGRNRKIIIAIVACSVISLAGCGGGSGGGGGKEGELPPTPPAITSSSSTPMPGETVNFSATSTDPKGQQITYSWDFGDLSTAAGSAATHMYPKEGEYSVSAMATNSAGLNSRSQMPVKVTAQAPTTPTLTMSNATPKPGDSVSFTAASTDPQKSALTYSWDFKDGATATGASVKHAFIAQGAYGATVTVTNAFNKVRSGTVNINVVALAPSTPSLLMEPASPKPGDVVTFTSASEDPQASALTYQWNFGDGANGSGASLTHRFSAEGTYKVDVTVSNAFNKSAAASASATVAYQPPTAPRITPAATTAVLDRAVAFTAESSDPGNYPLTYAWDFGDGMTAGNATNVAHTYKAVGKYSVNVTVTSSIGKSASSKASVSVAASPRDNEFGVYCAGPDCGAVDSSTYRGTGVGIWRYNNTTTSPATLDVAIAGVNPGQHALVLFSNGLETETTAPSSGALASPVTKPPAPRAMDNATKLANALDRRFHASHEEMLARNQRLAEQLANAARAAGVTASSLAALPGHAYAPPPLGTTRVWADEFESPAVSHSTKVAASCTAPDGRNIVLWLEVDFTSFPASEIETLRATFCGTDGGYNRVVRLIGSPWGATPTKHQSLLIQDSPALQDVNVVILNVPDSNWGGYFYGGNNFQRSLNHALAFFVNGPNAIGREDYYISVLIHELTHMVNFYQRAVVHAVGHDTWLEESTAMMSEDIVTPVVSPSMFNAVRNIRVPNYFRTGGAVSLVNWSQLDLSSYAAGGSFGAFLNRRYGVTLYQQIATCGESPHSTGTSYKCVDTLIRDAGGDGYADEFARFGASIFASLNDTAVPEGFGYPALTSNGYELQSYPLRQLLRSPPRTAVAIGSTLSATSHTYAFDTIAAGATKYARKSVTVPANSTLLLVIE